MAMTVVVDDKWLGVSEGARALGVAADTLRRMADRGEVGVIKTKYGRFINGEDLQRLAQERAARRQQEAVGG